jgi:multiple sugar transport system substrate-binding protein
MMEAEQYDRWLTGCLGHWSQPLRAYAASALWASDPKLAAFRAAMDTPYYDGYRGPIDAAAGAVTENWVVVDMFARVATGAMAPAESMREAARAARRWYHL